MKRIKKKMRPQYVFSLLVSIMVGVICCLEFRASARSQGVAKNSYLVVNRDLKKGAQVSFSDLSLVSMPMRQVPPGAITDQELALLKRHQLKASVSKGSVLVRGHLRPVDNLPMGVLVPPGHRAWSYCLDTWLPLRAGERVDFTYWSGTHPAVVAENAKILQVGHCAGGKNIVVAVRVKALEALEMARQTGKLSIVIRNPKERVRKRNKRPRRIYQRKITVWQE